MLRLRIAREKISIQHMLLFFILLLVLVPLVTNTSFSFYRSYEIIKTNTGRYVTKILEQTNREIDDRLNRIADETVQLIMNEQIQKHLNDSDNDSTSMKRMFTQLLTDYRINDSQTAMLVLYDENGEIVAGNPVITVKQLPDDIVAQAAALQGKPIWLSSSNLMYGPRTLLGIRAIVNLQGPQIKPIGYLLIGVSDEVIRQSIGQLQLGDGASAIIYDSRGMLVADQNNAIVFNYPPNIKLYRQMSGSFSEKYRSNRYFVTFHTSSATGLKTVGYVPDASLTPGINVILKFNILLMAVSVIIAIMLSALITRLLTKPLKKMMRQMRDIEMNQSAAPVILTHNKEIHSLSSSFHKMHSRLQELVYEVYEKELREKSAELKALQAQINPHFLYNTLDTLYWALYVKGEEEIADLIVSLSNMLRYNLKKDDHEVTIQDEVNHVKHYIHIQSVRYRDRIRFELDTDQAVMNCRMLKLMLQPLVENAILHGLEGRAEGGTIRISTKEDGADVLIHVSDDGVGMSPEKLRAFHENRQLGGGIGIHNVDGRIRIRFGEAYGLSIVSELGKGTTSTIRIPKTY